MKNIENIKVMKRYISVIIEKISKLAKVWELRSLPAAVKSVAEMTDTTLEPSMRYINWLVSAG